MPVRFTNSRAGAALDLVGEIDIPAPAMKNAASSAVARLPMNNRALPCVERRTSDLIDREIPADIFDASAFRPAKNSGRGVEQNSDEPPKGDSGGRRSRFFRPSATGSARLSQWQDRQGGLPRMKPFYAKRSANPSHRRSWQARADGRGEPARRYCGQAEK